MCEPLPSLSTLVHLFVRSLRVCLLQRSKLLDVWKHVHKRCASDMPCIVYGDVSRQSTQCLLLGLECGISRWSTMESSQRTAPYIESRHMTLKSLGGENRVRRDGIYWEPMTIWSGSCCSMPPPKLSDECGNTVVIGKPLA